MVSRLLVRTGKESSKAYGQEWITRGVSSPQDAPHQLQTHRKKRRAGHLVPYAESDDHLVLKVIIPSRRAQRLYTTDPSHGENDA